MKKWAKVWLIAGVGCCICGAAMTGIGAVSGGSKYVKAADLNRLDGNARKADHDTYLEKTKIDDFDAVDIRLGSMDLQVEASGDDFCYIAYRAESVKGKNPVHYQVQDGTLKIEETDNEKNSYFHVDIGFLSELLGDGALATDENVITLYVPESKIWTKADITTDMGDVLLNGCQITMGSITSDSGDIYFKDCDFQKMQMVSDVGDVSIIGQKKAIRAWNIQINTDIGDVHVDNALGGRMMEDEDDMTSSYIKEGKGGSLQIQIDSGDVSLECR